MSSNGILQIDTNYVQCGLGTLTFTVPSVYHNVAVSNTPFMVKCNASFPQDVGEGFGAGSGADQGLGVTGSSSAYLPSYQTTGAQQGLGNGALGLGFGGSVSDGASGNGSGYGSGAGGGTLGGFAQGGGGLGAASSGEGFGPSNSGYNQPIVNVKSPTSFPGVLSSLSIVVNQNGTPVYTAPAPGGYQEGVKFTANVPQCNPADVITIVFSSSNAADSVPLNVIKANVAVMAGEQ